MLDYRVSVHLYDDRRFPSKVSEYPLGAAVLPNNILQIRPIAYLPIDKVPGVSVANPIIIKIF